MRFRIDGRGRDEFLRGEDEEVRNSPENQEARVEHMVEWFRAERHEELEAANG